MLICYLYYQNITDKGNSQATEQMGLNEGGLDADFTLFFSSI
jgi:hypothetical protein